MKILMIANADSLWTKRFIENVLLPLQHEVELVSTGNEEYAAFYRENHVTVYSAYQPKKLLHRIPKVRAVMIFFRTIRLIKDHPSDVIQVNFVSAGTTKILSHISLKSRLILTYLGSDLLRSSEKQLNAAAAAVNQADTVVVMTEEMRRRFLSVYGETLRDKVKVIDMGASAFPSIDAALAHQNAEKERLLGKENLCRKVVVLGYNASPAQQHENMIQALKYLPEKIKSETLFLLPMTYPRGKEDYIDKIRLALNESGLLYRILTEFMDDQQIARLCASADIFVNAQSTDALSTSMLEYFYAKTNVLNGSWLHYGFLDENNIRYETFERVEDLGEKLAQMLASDPPAFLEENRKKLKNLCSWESCRDNWRKVYEKIG